jgi:cytochrome c-type biogenesis protein
MGEADRLAVAFAAGFVSVISPCVLPLVPGYLSAVTAVEADRLGEPGLVGRVVRGSVPFFGGFTVVFVVLGAAAVAIRDALGVTLQGEVAGFLMIVVGLAFMGLLPVPKRIVAPGLVAGARGRGSGLLLGAAFATCAAPCIGPVLAGTLLLASDSSTVSWGAVLLAAYSAGLGVAFIVAGVSFARAMAAFRWLRDRYVLLSAAGGAVLVGLGLLLFFDRFWWLRVGWNRLLGPVGLGV